jgi:hypothetical protein
MQMKCQPSIDNPCLTTSQIIDGGGEIVHQIDGSVSVWINTQDGIVPYNNINTKPCCEYLGYIFDVENQKCLWDDSISCDTCEMKIVINPNGNDGDYFFVNGNSECSLDISLDYIFKFDCSALESGETLNQDAILIQTQIDELTTLLNDKEDDCVLLSGACVQYTNIYTGMCYTIMVGKYMFDNDVTTPGDVAVLRQTPVSSTICCLTQEGLTRWQSILGDIKYDAWLASNGCDTTIYTNSQSNQLYTEGNDFAIQNNVPNPYFNETDAALCDKQNAYLQMQEVCGEYQDCLDEITDLQTQISDLETQLATLDAEGVLCNDPIQNLEDFTAWFSLDVETDTPMLYETVYEEQIFGIGEGNLMQYIIDSNTLSGIIISGETGVLPPFNTVEETCDYDEICKAKRDAFIRELYLAQYLPVYGEPVNSLENRELLDLMGGWYNSSWLSYNTTLNDPILIERIKNRKIRISIKVNTCCLDFGILLDKLKVTQNCLNIENTFIKITEPIGFELDKIVDNKKSWVSNELPEKRYYELDWRNTEYNINDYRLSINTKEIDLNIDPAKAIEGDVYKYFLNNPCGLGCTSGTTILEFENNIDFQTILDAQIINCGGCFTCFNQKQFENYECFELMNGEPYEFEFQESVSATTGSCINGIIWGITAELGNELVYDNPNFYSGNTITSIPNQNEFLNELNNISNSIGTIFIIDGNTISFVYENMCSVDGGLMGKQLKIDLNVTIESCNLKQFEDGDCFDFMDDVAYDFEG